jgi:hypothetical protein
MLSGTGIGLLSGAKNKKLITIIGAVMAATGIPGMISVGYRINEIITALGHFEGANLSDRIFTPSICFSSFC